MRFLSFLTCLFVLAACSEPNIPPAVNEGAVQTDSGSAPVEGVPENPIDPAGQANPQTAPLPGSPDVNAPNAPGGAGQQP